MKPQQALKWAQTRSKGQWDFIWRTGLFQWGLMMFGVFVGWQTTQHPDQFLFIVAKNLLVWTCGGLCYGYLVWHTLEWQYRRHAAGQSNPSADRRE